MSSRPQLIFILFRTCTSLLVLLAGVRSVEHCWKEELVNTRVCKNRECEKFGKLLSEMMDRSVNPCDDFYEYVCGGWVKKHPLPPYFNEWSTDSELQLQTYRLIQGMLEEPINDNDYSGMIAAKKFHIKCMKIPNNGMHDATIIRYNVKPIGYFPLISKSSDGKITWQLVHNYYLGFSGESGLFYLSIQSFRQNDYDPILNLQEVLSPFGLIREYIMSSDDQKKYVKFLVALVTKVFPEEIQSNSPSNMQKEIAAVVAFRMKLEKIIVKTKEASNLYHPITVNEMNERYSDIIRKENLKKEIDWIQVIQIFRKQRERREIIKAMMLNLGNRAYFQLLARLLNKTPDDVIANHIHLYFIERHTELDPDLKSLLLKVVIQNGKEHGKLRYYGQQWINCINQNVMKETIARRYVKEYFSWSTKKAVEDVVQELKDMIKIQFKESTWLSERMMYQFEKKIDHMKAIIGYPEYYDTPHKRLENPTASAMNPIKLDVFYLNKSNMLAISAACLRTPIYNMLLPYAVIYSGVGEFIAHEIYHAFGPQVVTFGPTKDSVSKKMAIDYGEKVLCFIKKFDKLPIQELREIQPAPTVDGTKTLDENISDLMGVQLAFWTFRKKVWHARQCETLPHMESFTCDQLFFISYAASFCSILSTDTFLSNVNGGVHSPPRIRVNMATSNFEVFNKIFKCNKDKSGVKHSSCNLWK